MNRYLAVSLLLTGTWLLFSFVPIVNLFILFYFMETIYWITINIGISDDPYFAFGWIFYGILAIGILFIYLKIEKVWKEVILGFLYFCFGTVSLFPLMLKLLSTVEPPYILDFIAITIIAGLILTAVGFIKFKSIRNSLI